MLSYACHYSSLYHSRFIFKVTLQSVCFFCLLIVNLLLMFICLIFVCSGKSGKRKRKVSDSKVMFLINRLGTW